MFIIKCNLGWFNGFDANGVVRVYCGQGCQDAGRMEDEAN